VLEVRGLQVNYGAIEAVKGISLDVAERELVALIGANGAGKTTTLRTISGVLRPSAGSIRFDGRDLVREQPHTIVGAGVVQAPEGRQIFAGLTVRENLAMGAISRKDTGDHSDDVERVTGLFPILGERMSQRAGTLSGGEQQMLAIARALMARPRLLLMDEPSLGLAPLIVNRIFSVIAQLKAEGVTILLVEQNARKALAVADRAYIMETGHVSFGGTASELASDAALVSAYLGG